MPSTYAGDCRRAIALTVQHAQGDLDGVNAILRESAEAGRATELILAILDAFQSIVPVLHTELGLLSLSQTVHAIAHDDTADADRRRAAALVVAHSKDDVNGINKVIHETKEADRVTPLILGILGLYDRLVPAATSSLGIAALQSTILDLAAHEVADQ